MDPPVKDNPVEPQEEHTNLKRNVSYQHGTSLLRLTVGKKNLDTVMVN